MDTVVIKIYGPNKFKLLDRSQFVPEVTKRAYKDLSPTERSLHPSRTYLRHFVLRPKNLHDYKDDYLPKVEIFENLTEDRKDIRYVMKIEFSVPKLLYGNSVLEVVEKDKDRVLIELKAALAKVNIIVETEHLTKATLTAVHLCKNVPLPRTIKMREILNDLERIDINKVYDVTGKKFKNGGRVLNIYSGTIEHVFYDKIEDSIRPKNKRSDKAHIDLERDFTEKHNLRDREIFRYEYRIKKGQTVKREINAALEREPEKAVLFKDIFTKGLLKKLTVTSWRGIIERPENQLALFRITDKLSLFMHVLAEAERKGTGAHSLNTALTSYGLAVVIQDHGAKEVRKAIFSIWNTDHPERLTRRIEQTAALTQGLPYSNGISFVDTAVENYQPITLDLIENGL